ncbi:MAG: peptidoglycan editing factor PgeF [Anaerolineae bacterium]
MQRIADAAPVYYRFEQWANETAFQHGVFTRLGGSSYAPFDSLNVGGTVGDDLVNVRHNLARIYETLGVLGDAACTVWQVHSADVIAVTSKPVGRHWLARADAMITDRPELPLTMRFADCTPIMLYDPQHRAIGIAHAGWRGTVQQIAAKTIQAMQAAYDTDPRVVQAAIGPSIGPEKYQVGEEVVAAVREAFGTIDGLVRRAKDGTAYLDLWAANRRSLEQAGLRAEHIEVSGICTASRTDEFYSHRAERGRTGRFCAVIALRAR